MHLVLNQAGNWQLFLLHVSLRFSAAIRSAVTCMGAGLVLFLLDVLRLSTAGFHFDDLLYALELHAAVLLIVLPLLQITYFVLRVLAALSGRFHSSGGFLTGVSLFLLIQPAASSLSSILVPQIHWAVAPAAALLGGILIAFPLMALIPDLRGENAPLLTISSAVAWLLTDHTAASAFAAGVDLRDRLVLACVLYLWFQIRRRLHRSPVYAPFSISWKAKLVGIGFGIACAALSLLDPDTAIWPVSLFLLLSWTLTAWMLPGKARARTSRAAQFLLLAYVAGAGGALHLTWFSQDAAAIASRFLRSQSLAGRFLLNLGVLFDGDYDGNSRWPGQDPDDRDPCVRKDGLNRCRRAARFDPAPSASRVLLVTRFSSIPPQQGLDGAFFLASNQQEEILLSIVRAMDGYSIYAGASGDSAFSQLSEDGYRIICIFSGVNTRYAPKLTHGCQVFQEVKDEAEALKIVRTYEEKRTFAWIHSEVSGPGLEDVKGYQLHSVWLDPVRQTGLYKSKSSAIPRVSSHVLAAVLDQEPGNVQDVVDIRHMSTPPPVLMRILGIDLRRFIQSVRYVPRAGSGILDRRTLEGYTGASDLSGLGDLP